MLPSMTLLGKLKREGRDAGYSGLLKTDCPYSSPALKGAWEAGWRLGVRDSDEDMEDGKHHHLYRKSKLVR